MDEDKARIFDALMRLAEFRNSRIADRRSHEWKVTVGLWALLGAGILHPPHISWLWAFLVAIVVVHAFFWIGSHWYASKYDIEVSFYYTDRARIRSP